jgi:uncharacterized protein (DUF362 family)
MTGAGLLVYSQSGKAQQAVTALTETIRPNPSRSRVSLVRGEDRRKNVYNALMAVDDEMRRKLARRKYVLIKPNIVSTVNQLATTNADAVRGILDYLGPRFKGPVMIAESSAGDTLEGYESFGYNKLVSEYRSQRVSLLDLNREAKYEALPLIDFDVHLVPVRLAARLLDPDAFVICSAVTKSHNTVVVTLSVKNMVLGAPLHSAPGETPKWSDKRRYHTGIRFTHYNMLRTAQRMQPNWGATIIDGFEGMEGNGPGAGTPVPHRIAIASTDYIAADRVAIETMGVNADWVGYLRYCDQVGLGNYNLAKIDVVGEKIESVRRKYRLHDSIQQQIDEWMQPMRDLPVNLGRADLPGEGIPV